MDRKNNVMIKNETKSVIVEGFVVYFCDYTVASLTRYKKSLQNYTYIIYTTVYTILYTYSIYYILYYTHIIYANLNDTMILYC